MNDEKDSKVASTERFNFHFHLWLKTTAFIILLTIIAIVFMPQAISTKTGNRFILKAIKKRTGSDVAFEHLSYSWFDGLQIKDLSYKDPQRDIELQVANLKSKPSLISLLAHNIILRETIIDKCNLRVSIPYQQLNETQSEELLQAGSSSKRTFKISSLDITVNDSNANIILKDVNGKDIQLKLSDFNLHSLINTNGELSELDLVTKLGDDKANSKIDIDSKFILPKKGWKISDTTADLDVVIKDLDLETVSPLFALAQIKVKSKGLLNSTITAQIKDGSIDECKVEADSEAIEFGGEILNSDVFKADNLELRADLMSKDSAFDIRKLSLKSDWFDVNVSGDLPYNLGSFEELLSDNSTNILKAKIDVQLADFTNQFSNTIKMPKGLDVESGRLRATVKKGSTENNQDAILLNASIGHLSVVKDSKRINLGRAANIDSALFLGDEKHLNYTCNFKSYFCDIDIAGNLKKVGYGVDVDVSRTLNTLDSFIPLDGLSIKGDIKSNGDVVFGKDIDIAGTGDIKNLSITKKDNDLSFDKVECNYNLSLLEAGDIFVKSSRLLSGADSVEVKKFKVELSDQSQKKYSGDINIDCDLARLLSIMQFAQDSYKDVTLGGRLTSALGVDVSGDIVTIKTKKTKVDKLKIARGSDKEFYQEYIDLDLYANLDLNTQIYDVQMNLDSPSVNITDAKVSQKVSKGQANINGNIVAQLDFARIGDLASEFIPDELKISGQREAKCEFKGAYPVQFPEKIFDDLTAHLSFGFESADYMGLSFGRSDFDITISDGILKLAPFKSRVNNGYVNFAAYSKLDESPRLMIIPHPISIIDNVELNKETTEKMLKYVNPLFAGAIEAAGVVNLKCDKLIIPLGNASKDNTEIEGTISLDNVYLSSNGLMGEISKHIGVSKDEPIRIRETYFTLKNSVLSYKDMQVDFGNNPVNFRGKIYLDDRIDMDVVLPYTYSGRTITTGQDSDERVVLPITGDLNNPKIDFNAAIDHGVKKMIDGELQRQLKKLFR